MAAILGNRGQHIITGEIGQAPDMHIEYHADGYVRSTSTKLKWMQQHTQGKWASRKSVKEKSKEQEISRDRKKKKTSTTTRTAFFYGFLRMLPSVLITKRGEEEKKHVEGTTHENDDTNY